MAIGRLSSLASSLSQVLILTTAIVFVPRSFAEETWEAMKLARVRQDAQKDQHVSLAGGLLSLRVRLRHFLGRDSMTEAEHCDHV